MLKFSRKALLFTVHPFPSLCFVKDDLSGFQKKLEWLVKGDMGFIAVR